MTTPPSASETREIADPGKENQRTQIQQLNQTRAQITDIRTKGRLRLSEQQRLVALRSTVSEYISQLSPYLCDEQLQPDDEKALWDEQPLGSYTIAPPSFESLNVGNRFEVDEAPGSEQIEVVGVSDILRLGVEFPVEFDFKVISPVSGRDEISVQKNGAPPAETLLEAVIELDAFRRRTGLGLQLEDESPHGET